METLFIGIAIFAIPALHRATKKNKWVLILFGTWAIILSGLALSGFYEVTDSVPPRIVTVPVPSLAIVIFLFRRQD